MDNLEREILASTEKTPSTWWRYIDDVFATWPRDEEQLKVLLEFLNEFHQELIRAPRSGAKERVTPHRRVGTCSVP